jgi:GDPmannose 4,6-dehydratase
MLARLLGEVQADELYNLGAQSHVGVSFEMPVYTANITALGALRVLESVREAQVRPRIHQASSSEMFGTAPRLRARTHSFSPSPPTPHRRFLPTNWRVCTETPMVCPWLVGSCSTTSLHAAERLCHREGDGGGRPHLWGKRGCCLCLGNLNACRDWGYAPEYVEAIWSHAPSDMTNLIQSTLVSGKRFVLWSWLD